MIELVLLGVELILLFFVSGLAINELYHAVKMVTKNDSFIFTLLSLIFLPGTIIHEFSHFLAATVLFLRVHEIRILPEWDHHYVKMGSVTYEKTDVIRSVLVGIAPFFGAFGVFLLMDRLSVFPASHIWLNIGYGYLIWVIASHMFSSKQDLIDLGYMIPIFFILMGAMYVFDVKVNNDIFLYISGIIFDVAKKMQFYVSLTLGINIGLIIMIKSLRIVFHR